jgi:glycosyltransferase involved in cell wall biosynthesis
MPTADRSDFALQSVRCFLRQEYPERELIIVDDGMADLSGLLPPDPRVRYLRIPSRLSAGAKRNFACEQARGSIIAHWDDDDWYGPSRLRIQVQPLLSGSADITGLATDVFFDLPAWRFWRCGRLLHQRLFAHGVNGGTLVYQRHVWEKLARYPDESPSPGAEFLDRAIGRGARLNKQANRGLFLYVRHWANASRFRCGELPDQSGWQEAEEPALPLEDRAFYRALHEQAHRRKPLVTCIMPTADRRAFVPLAIRNFLRQDYENRELVIVDDGADAVGDIVPEAPGIRYLRLGERLSVGEKRNLACREARGEIVAHWDDDDWMASWRLSYQVERLLAEDADVCGVNRLHFWSPGDNRAWRYWYASGPAWVVGGTLCYRKAFWERNPFPDTNVGEDNLFIWSPVEKKIAVLDNPDFYVGTVHGTNTSPKETVGEFWGPGDVADVRRIMGDDWTDYAKAAPRKLVLRPRAPAPMVSCVMATRNRPEFARQAIRCFLRQTLYPSELIVVDDGESPVEDLCAGLLSVRYLRLPARTNLGSKLNIGIEQARGEVIQKWDDDDWYSARFLECAAAHLDSAGVIVAWDCFLTLLAGERTLRHSGHGWAAGATLCFHRDLWRGTPFRDVPSAVDRWFLTDSGAKIRRVCEPELFLAVRHGANTWNVMEGGAGDVNGYFTKLPPYPKPLGDILEPIDRAFYEPLIAAEAARR